jgi:alpha-beta hydrolase superfamily lysophospholipase
LELGVKKAKPSQNSLPRILTVLCLFSAAAFLYFAYGYLPEKVAGSIVARSRIRQPLTTTPRAAGFAYRDVSFKTQDGISISGWWLPPAKGQVPRGTVLMSHGIFKNREQVLTRAEFLSSKGYQVLLFDHRGNGLSGEAPTSGGVLEAGDYLASVEYLKSEHWLKKPLIFFGFSMGAMSALRAVNQDPKVDAVIADSPLPNVKAYVSRRTIGGSFTGLPGFLKVCLRDYDRLTGLSLTVRDLDLTGVVQQLHEKPVLYITGEKDDLAKPEEVRNLFNATDSHHRRLVYIPEAGHEETYLKFPLIYEKAIASFLSDLRAGFPQPTQEEIFKKIDQQAKAQQKRATLHTQ